MKKQIPKGLSWQPREEAEDPADEPSRTRMRPPEDRAESERPPRATTTRRRPDASRSLYSVHNPGHVDEICVPTGLAPMPRIPGKARPRTRPQAPTSPDPSMAWQPAPAAPPTRASVPDPHGGLEMPAEPPPPLRRQVSPAERRGVSGERTRPDAAHAPTEPAFAAVPDPTPGSVSGLADTLVGQAAPVVPEAAPTAHVAHGAGPALPPADVAWKPAPPEPDPRAMAVSSALPPWQPAHPQPPGERTKGTLMGFVPPRVSSQPPVVSPGGTLHGVEPPQPERPTPAVLERPDGVLTDGGMPPEPPPAAPRPARTRAGTVMGFAPPRARADDEPDR